MDSLQLQQQHVLFLSTVGNMDSRRHHPKLRGNVVGARLRQELHVVRASLNFERS